MKKLALKSIFTILFVAASGLFYLNQSIHQYVNSTLVLENDRELWVESGASLNGTLLKLERQGVISEIWKLKLFVKLNPEFKNIKQGLYQLTTDDTPLTLMEKLIQGDVKKFSITLIEGHTIKEWKNTIEQAPRLTLPDDVFTQVLANNGDDSGLPEGRFFPDTYHYTSATKVSSILDQSYKRMSQELERIWRQRDRNITVDTPYQLLILASIIEEETAKAEERTLISAVFNNRLKKRMRLQTDPTVIYGMGERYQGNITRKDLREKTPFNTYRIKGLPPTPIAAPSLASLEAAAHPADVSFLYFVSKNDGSHIFSNTLREHNLAVNKYQRSKR